jgi:hypothetical protein
MRRADQDLLSHSLIPWRIRDEVQRSGSAAPDYERYESGLRDRLVGHKCSCTLAIYSGAEHADKLAHDIAAWGDDRTGDAAM